MEDMQNAIMHLREHQTFPATKAELIEACNKLSDFSEADKKEFEHQLPDKTYHSAEEVMEVLGWKVGTR